MSKKMIIIIAAGGLVSFGATFALAWRTNPSPKSQSVPGEISQPVRVGQAEDGNEMKLAQIDYAAQAVANTGNSTMENNMTDKQLKNLAFELQQRIQEYNNKLRSLQQRESRLQITQDALRKDIENLNNLRLELATMVVSEKEQRDRLLKSRIEIAEAERSNLAKIAATYDKMEAVSAGRILAGMCKSPSEGIESGGGQSNINDAVKILHYMNERAKAKLLTELVTSEPELAAVLCRKLKQITETN